MTYVVALSFCEQDSGIAERVSAFFNERNVSCYFYKREPRINSLMFDLHASIYTSAIARVYFIRRETFGRPYTRFELSCGKARKNNFLIVERGLLEAIIPDEFQFMGDAGWTVIWRPAHNEVYQTITDQILDAIRQNDLT